MRRETRIRGTGVLGSVEVCPLNDVLMVMCCVQGMVQFTKIRHNGTAAFIL